MKRTKLLLGSMALATLAAGVATVGVINNDVVRSYNYYQLDGKNADASSWSGAQELYFNLYKDAVTGKIERSIYQQAYQDARWLSMQKSASMTFTDEGPDNIGGRTRAIIVDPTNDNIVYAGAVDGGLFKSTNGGNNWSRFQAWDAVGTMSISSVCITKNGVLYVATGGETFEGSLTGESSGTQNGNGVWYLGSDGVFYQVTASANQNINKVVPDMTKNEMVYVVGSGTYDGLHRIENASSGTPVITDFTSAGGSTIAGESGDVKVSPDGQVIIFNTLHKIYLSQDGGATFTNIHNSSSVNGGPTINASGASRWEFSVSHEKNSDNKYSLFAVAATGGGGLMKGVWHSEDNGSSWYAIAPGSTTGWTPLTSQYGQGNYDLVIDNVKGVSNDCILGGIDLYRWTRTPGNDPSNGQWEKISHWAYPSHHPKYVHADNHRITWDSQGRMFVGNDGGVQISWDNTTSIFTTANKGYGVTQFYACAYGPDGAVMGGAQDNGTMYNDHKGLSYLEHDEVNGGDGFECEISWLNPKVLISSVYNASIGISEDGGSMWTSLVPPCGSLIPGETCGSFYSALRLFENNNDVFTQDSVQYIPSESKFAGDTVYYNSLTLNMPLSYVLTQNVLVSWDSILIGNQDSITPLYDTLPANTWHYYNPIPDTALVPDYVQTMFVTLGDAVYLTRDALRFSGVKEWWKLDGVNGTPQSYEFSKDGNTLWIGTQGGALYRVSNLNNCYAANQIDAAYKNDATYNVDIDFIGGMGNIITDISVDPNNPDNVALTVGGTSGTNVRYSTNATAATPTFVGKDGNLPNMPAFGVEILVNSNGKKAIIGTEYGAYYTQDISVSSPVWEAQNDEIGMIPVFDVRQQWRDFGAGGTVTNPGIVYLGTHARGIWRTTQFLGNNNLSPIANKINKELDGVKLFPNPMVNFSKLAFEVGVRTDVEVEIFNINGVKVKTVLWKNMSAGTHTMEFDGSDLPVGTYILTMKAGSAKKVTKFVKL